MAAWTAHGMCMEYMASWLHVIEAHLASVSRGSSEIPARSTHCLDGIRCSSHLAQGSVRKPARELPLSTPPPSQGSNAAPRLAQGSKERGPWLHPRRPRRRKRPFGAEAPHPVEMERLRSGEATRSCCAGRQVACGAYVCVRTRRKCSYMNGATGFDATARPY